MRTVDHDEEDGRKCWLSDDELDDVLDEPTDSERRIALALMGRCGLRKDELLRVEPRDLVDGPSGVHLQVESAKTDVHREPPVPGDLVTRIRTFTDAVDAGAGEPVVDVSKRTVERWVDRAADRRRDATDDPSWRYLTPHDLRRTWGTLLLEHGVEPGMVMEWGGWSSWTSFRDSYLGEFSPAAVSRERDKVEWL